MPHTINQKDTIVTVRFQPGTDYEELREAILESDSFPDSRLEIWDLSQLDLDLAGDRIRSLAELAKAKNHRPAKSAILVHGDLAYGLFRMFAMNREQPEIETQVFTDENEARAWLLSEQP
jgi:hypothetical protein